MRKAKQITAYSVHGEIFEGTVAELMEQKEITNRRGLYKKAGAGGKEGERWAVGSVPVFEKSLITSDQQYVFNCAQKMIRDAEERTDHIKMVEGMVEAWRNQLIIREDQELEAVEKRVEEKRVIKKAPLKYRIQYYADKHNMSFEEAKEKWFSNHS